MSDFRSRRYFVQGLAASIGFAACSTGARLPAGAAQALAPTGRLRASINLGNPILARALPGSETRAPTSPQVVDHFLLHNADVAAGVKQQLQADALRLGSLRLLPGRFMVIEQAMGSPAARGDAAGDALKAYVEWAKRSGFVADALARHGIQGAIVAPAAA